MNHHIKLVQSAKKKGEKNPMFHKQHSEETRRKIIQKIKEMWMKEEEEEG